MSYPFPDDVRNPDRDEPNPFAEDHVDDGDVDEQDASAENGDYRASKRSGDYRPEYVATQSNRAILILCLGALGFGLSVAGWTAYTKFTELILMPLISLAFSLTAIALGWADAGAIKAGAKRNNNVGWLLLGMALGLLALANSAAFVIVGIVVTDLLRF